MFIEKKWHMMAFERWMLNPPKKHMKRGIHFMVRKRPMWKGVF
jgi:hypothetical protein